MRSFIYVEYDGFPFGLRNFIENGVHDVQEFVTRQRCWRLLFKVVNEVVQQEIRACKSRLI